METYCNLIIKNTINNLGGLKNEGLVPRIFYPQNKAIQKNLFDELGHYNFNVGLYENLEL
jgi:hypothetical protein